MHVKHADSEDSGHPAGDFTSKEARSSLLDFLSGMVTKAQTAHNDAEAARRKELAHDGAKPFISGKMDGKQAEEQIDNYWNSLSGDKAAVATKRAPNYGRGQDMPSMKSDESAGPKVKDPKQASGATGRHSQHRSSKEHSSGSVESEVNSLGLPTGSQAAVSSPKHKVSSLQSHLSLENYFDDLVTNAKAKDHYDEKTAQIQRAEAMKKMQDEAKEAEQASAEAAKIFSEKPSVRPTGAYPAVVPATPAQTPLGPSMQPQPAVQRVMRTAGAQLPVVQPSPGSAFRASPPPPPPSETPQQKYFENAFNSFLSQVNSQVGSKEAGNVAAQAASAIAQAMPQTPTVSPPQQIEQPPLASRPVVSDLKVAAALSPRGESAPRLQTASANPQDMAKVSASLCSVRISEAQPVQLT